MQKSWQFLNQPYPECKGVLNYLLSSLLIGAFIALFLYIFEPFGIDKAGDSKAWYCASFGLITFVVSFGSDLFIRYMLRLHRDTEKWVFWKWMISVLVIVLLIAIANYLFMWWQSPLEWSLESLMSMIVATFLIGVFPIFFSGLVNSNRAIRRNQSLAMELNQRLSEPRDLVPLGKISASSTFDLNPDNILYVEAMQNYVVIHYLKEGQKHQKIIRSTLAAVEEKLNNSRVERTHRSFLVNREKIISVRGNAQGLKLQIAGLDQKEIPVSRKFIKRFRVN